MSWRAGIHGYVAKWNVVTGAIGRPNAPHLARPGRFQRDCFSYDASTVEIWFMHRCAQAIGVGADLDLEIWPDAYGLAFAFRPPTTAWNLVCGVAEGRYDQCSAGFGIGGSTVERQGSLVFDSIFFAALREISICPRGACPGAICWHSGNGPAAISREAKALLPEWSRSRAAHSIAAFAG